MGICKRQSWSYEHVYGSLFVSQGELHLHTDLWTCHPVETTRAGRQGRCQCPEKNTSFLLPDSVIGFVAPSLCHLRSQDSEWHTQEEEGPLTAPPASSNLHSSRPNKPLLGNTQSILSQQQENVSNNNRFHTITCFGFSKWLMDSS